MIALSVTAALLLDYILGETKRWHPLVGFGRLANLVEAKLRKDESTPRQARLRGICAVALLIIPCAFILTGLAQTAADEMLIGIVLLYIAIGARSLTEHAMQIHDALVANDIAQARAYTGFIVSRDTSALNEHEIAKATVESVLENGCDAIFGAIFWFIVAGIPGVVIYRLANTLDAMWGYKNSRYLHFGWAAARLDDLLNYIPARLTALTYALVGESRKALLCWRDQGRQWKSPNAGPVMAAGAGALSLKLGGAAIYHGKRQERPELGLDKTPHADDIKRSVQLVHRSIGLWLVAILLGGWLFA